jgi:hypothetical protein
MHRSIQSIVDSRSLPEQRLEAIGALLEGSGFTFQEGQNWDFKRGWAIFLLE